MCGQLVVGHLSHQQIAHQRTGAVGTAIGQEYTHGAVNAHNAGTIEQSVEGGDIAEPHEPFG